MTKQQGVHQLEVRVSKSEIRSPKFQIQNVKFEVDRINNSSGFKNFVLFAQVIYPCSNLGFLKSLKSEV